KQWRRPRAPTNAFRHTRFRTRVVLWLDYRDLLEQPVGFCERSHACFSKLEPFLDHFGRFETEEDVEHLIGVAAEQRPGEHHRVLRASSQRAECISLGSISFQLVHLIRDGIIEEIRHVATDEINGSETPYFLPVSLPHRAE